MTALMCDNCMLLALNVLSCCLDDVGAACWSCWVVGLLSGGWVFFGDSVVVMLQF